VAVNIKSQSASGDGCPSGWVATEFINDAWATVNATYFTIEYPELTPEVTAGQGKPFAAKSCHVNLELDDLPAGKQVAFTTAYFGGIYFWSHGPAEWELNLSSQTQYRNGPISMVNQSSLRRLNFRS
jgi:hypothetical protein